MRDREPTMRSRELGEGLRRAMETAGLTGVEAARGLDWSPSRVSRMLSGTRGTTEVDVAMFLTVCGVRGRERKRLLAVCQDQGVPGWLQEYGDRLPKQLVTLVDHEDKAQRINGFEATWVPGLLQTPDYARALISRVVTVPADEVEERVAARLARQELFTRGTGAQFGFFLHETALRLPVGGAAVLSDQLHHLLRMSVRPPVTIRVIPAALGGHAAGNGSFRLMEFPEFHPVVYLEGETTALFLEKREQVTAYRRILYALAEVALDEGHSRGPDCHRGTGALRGPGGLTMSTPDRNGVVWRTSSYTGGSGDCVEVAAAAGTVLVRDTKDREGPVLTVRTTAWRAFLADIPR